MISGITFASGSLLRSYRVDTDTSLKVVELEEYTILTCQRVCSGLVGQLLSFFGVISHLDA